VKTLALAVTLFATVNTNALAADMAVKAPPAPVPVYSWAGFYVGGNIGYSWGEARNDWNVFAPGLGGNTTTCAIAGTAMCISGSDAARLEGIIGGLQAGYNWTSGKYLVGIEGDIQYSGQKRDQNFNGTYLPTAVMLGNVVPGSFTSSYSESLQWLGTLRGRLGYVNDRWMVFATGGVAVGQVKTSGSNAVIGIIGNQTGCTPVNQVAESCPFGAFNSSETKVGWALGAGAEGFISGNWTWKVEYLHVDLGKSGASFATPAGCFGGTIAAGGGAGAFCSLYGAGRGSISNRITDEIVRVGINYHFAGGSVVAKY
jgi:outer membrane immunogenic protein